MHVTLFISTAEYQELMKILSRSIIKKKTHKELKETSGFLVCGGFSRFTIKAKKEVFA